MRPLLLMLLPSLCRAWPQLESSRSILVSDAPGHSETTMDLYPQYPWHPIGIPGVAPPGGFGPTSVHPPWPSPRAVLAVQTTVGPPDHSPGTPSNANPNSSRTSAHLVDSFVRYSGSPTSSATRRIDIWRISLDTASNLSLPAVIFSPPECTCIFSAPHIVALAPRTRPGLLPPNEQFQDLCWP